MSNKNPESVPCPWCDAKIGDPCTVNGEPMGIFRAHEHRYIALKESKVQS